MSQWPFAARSAEVDRIAHALRSGRTGGVVIAGAAGVGKTRLALEVARGSGTRAPVHVVRATRAAAGIPLGALAHLLPRADVPAGGNPVRWAADGVAPPDGPRPLLVIDDAHAVDETTAAVVHLLVHTGRARVLATVRTGEKPPDPIVALWKDDLATRVDLAPFDPEGTTAILTGALDGPVARDTCERLHQVSGGNALLLHELVTAARDGGALDVSRGVWWLSRDIPLSDRLIDVVEERLGALSDDEREALEYVAYAEPFGVTLLERLVDPEVVEAIETRGLIRLVHDDQRLEAHLGHPLFGELIRSRCGDRRRRRILAGLVTTVSATGARRRDDPMRIAVWAVDSGSSANPQALLDGARLAWSLQDQPLAARLGQAAVLASGHAAEPTLFLVDVLNAANDFDEVERYLDAVPPGDYDERTRTLLAVARINMLAWGHGRQQEALDLGVATLRDIADPANRQEIEYTSIEITNAMGEWAEAAERCRRIIAAPASPVWANQARATLCSALVSLGRLQEVVGTADELLADRLYWAEEYPELGGHTCVMAVLAHQTLGGTDDFDIAVERLEAEAGAIELFANSILVSRGVGALMRGRIGSAIALLREAETAPTNRINTLSGMSELARALAHAGDADAAAHALGVGSERTYRVRTQKVPFAVRLNAPWILAAQGRVSEAIDGCVEAAEFFRAKRTARRELIALHDAVRMGGGDRVADRLTELADGYDGTFATVCAAHGRAAARRDAAALERVATDFEALGRVLYAAEACAHAAEAYAAAGSAGPAKAAAARARALANRCEGAKTPALAKLNAPGLTAREMEIAMMAARGLSSASIAESLVLAVRTVDNHLRSVYQKLDVTGRGDLRTVLGP